MGINEVRIISMWLTYQCCLIPLVRKYYLLVYSGTTNSGGGGEGGGALRWTINRQPVLSFR